MPCVGRVNNMSTGSRRTQCNLTDAGHVLRCVIQHSLRDDVPGLAAELAYKFFLGLFPFLMFLTALGGFVSSQLGIRNPAENVAETSQEGLPPSAADLVTRELRAMIGERNPGLLSGSIVGALLIATTGVTSIMKASNRAYEVPETRPWLQRSLLALLLTVLAGGFIIIALALALVGQIVGSQIAQVFQIEGAFWTIYTIARWPLITLLVLAAVALLYRLAPNVDQPIGWVTPGAVLFVLSWLGGTYIFSGYVASFHTYDFVYGTAGGVVVLLVWFYMSGLMLLLGLELNQAIDQQIGPRQIENRARELGATRAEDRIPVGSSVG